MATPQTYKVKKGDTLGGIAQRFGVGLDAISGYRSGNKDLIFPDEELTINAAPETDTRESDYRSTMAEEFDDDQSSSDISSYETDFETYKKERESAYETLRDISTTTFETEYEDRDLEKKRQRIESLDSDIASAKQARDDAINKVRNNPGLSASQMTGDIAKIRDAQNATINNLIGERNSVAGDYNSELDEIDAIVERAASDAQLAFAYWDGLVSETGDYITDYQTLLRDELADDQAQDNFEAQLAQQLQIAQMRDTGGGGTSDDWRLVYDDAGTPLYWFNSATREIDYNVGNPPEGGGGGIDPFAEAEEEVAADGDDIPWWQFWRR